MENIKKFITNHGIEDGNIYVYHVESGIKTPTEKNVLGLYYNTEFEEFSMLIESDGSTYFETATDIIEDVFQQVAKREIDAILHDGIVSFKYKKKDGSIREALGTLLPDMCPETKGSGRPMPEHLQLYYDLEKKSYKSFNKSNLLEVRKEEK